MRRLKILIVIPSVVVDPGIGLARRRALIVRILLQPQTILLHTIIMVRIIGIKEV